LLIHTFRCVIVVVAPDGGLFFVGAESKNPMEKTKKKRQEQVCLQGDKHSTLVQSVGVHSSA